MKTKLELTIYGIPRTKKNSQIPAVNKKTGRPMIIQSKLYRDYEKDAIKQIEDLHKTWHIDYLCNCQYVYYRPTKIRVDQSNLMAATDDILVKAGVLEDDNWKIIEDFCAYMGNRNEIWYATNMEIYEYVQAYHQLVFSTDSSVVYNPSAIDVYFSWNRVVHCVKAGKQLRIQEG